jgi:pseudouridine-5'-phosphate glycosidase
MDSPEDIAQAHIMRQALGLPGGQLVANPIPADSQISQEELTPIIEMAVAEAERKGILGKEVTPYLLGRIVELTEGRSLTSNIALVLNNARLAAQIARKICDIRKEML